MSNVTIVIVSYKQKLNNHINIRKLNLKKNKRYKMYYIYSKLSYSIKNYYSINIINKRLLNTILKSNPTI